MPRSHYFRADSLRHHTQHSTHAELINRKSTAGNSAEPAPGVPAYLGVYLGSAGSTLSKAPLLRLPESVNKQTNKHEHDKRYIRSIGQPDHTQLPGRAILRYPCGRPGGVPCPTPDRPCFKKKNSVAVRATWQKKLPGSAETVLSASLARDAAHLEASAVARLASRVSRLDRRVRGRCHRQCCQPGCLHIRMHRDLR